MSDNNVMLWITILSGLANVTIAVTVVATRSWAKRDAIEAIVSALSGKLEVLTESVRSVTTRGDERHASVEISLREMRDTMHREHTRINGMLDTLSSRLQRIEVGQHINK